MIANLIRKHILQMINDNGGTIMYEVNSVRTIRSGFNSRKILAMIDKKQQSQLLIISLSICIVLLSFGIISTKVIAQKVSSQEKMITSVRIEKGDTLWSIATEYITDEYKDINSYISEIKKTNRLSSDIIHEGRYILVPYYTTK